MWRKKIEPLEREQLETGLRDSTPALEYRMKLSADKPSVREAFFGNVGVDGAVIGGPVFNECQWRILWQTFVGMRSRAKG